MHSLLLTDGSTLLVGGLHNHILEIDLNTVQETQKVPAWARKDPSRVCGYCGGGSGSYLSWEHAKDVCVNFLFIWFVGRIILTGFSCFSPQYAVETPGVTIMRQTNRFFFCGHTSGKVAKYHFSSYHGVLFHQMCDWVQPFPQFWGCNWSEERFELSSYPAILYCEIIFQPDVSEP